MSKTTYLPISEFPGYRVGDDGSVWSKHRRGPGTKLNAEWRIVKGGHNTQGYRQVILCNKTKSIRLVRAVHRIVLETFVGPCPDSMECLHKNGIKTDNRLENLMWGTHKVNIETRTTTKLTPADIKKIRGFSSRGLSQIKIATIFGVHQSAISRILSGDRWSHIL